MIPGVYDLPTVAATLGKSPRWLKEWLHAHPCGRKVGRTIVFTDADVQALMESFPRKEGTKCRLNLSRRTSRGGGRTTGSEEPISVSQWIAQQKRLTKKQPSDCLTDGATKSNVVRLPASKN